MWQDSADDYLDYVARCILNWGDSAREASNGVLNYGLWLVQTERREPIGQNTTTSGARPIENA